MFRLDGRIALITGAATGLGAATAVALASQGASVVVSDKPGESLERTLDEAAQHGGRVLATPLDVRDNDQQAAAVRIAVEAFGRIDILVNNAGINRPATGLDVTEQIWEEHFATNVRGGFFLAQKIAPFMIERGWGRIIWISSQSGLVGIPGQPVYCGTKGAVIQVVRTLGLEWAKHGITVNSVAPTFVETKMTSRRLNIPEFLNFVLNKIPAHRLAMPQEIAAAVVFLASEEAAMVNCHTLSVDGGWTAW
ncbi:MAG: SDR family oxidoreductase [Bryobacterales bacterium]|nr:SDR family oxidoreductase [Bryobacterales bacterium]